VRTGLPTVPLAQTTDPVSLQDVLNVFALPTDQRLRALITELGIGDRRSRAGPQRAAAARETPR